MSFIVSTPLKVFGIAAGFVVVTLILITFSNTAYPFSRMDMFSGKPSTVCNTIVTTTDGHIIPTMDISILLEIQNIYAAHWTDGTICNHIASSRFRTSISPYQVRVVCFSYAKGGVIQKKETIGAQCESL